mmetsp:Transcript_1256/g.2312  ORF Transcript_1256/g.2312 Transcript_1256/m.2312 type:complete len:96 (+) Transcript_1256:877-1164(+)
MPHQPAKRQKLSHRQGLLLISEGGIFNSFQTGAAGCRQGRCSMCLIVLGMAMGRCPHHKHAARAGAFGCPGLLGSILPAAAAALETLSSYFCRGT